jgi:hypothetical protein
MQHCILLRVFQQGEREEWLADRRTKGCQLLRLGSITAHEKFIYRLVKDYCQLDGDVEQK